MRATRATRRDDPERLRQGLLPELLALHPQVPPVQDGRWQRLTKLGPDAQRNLFAVLGTPKERVARLGCILNNSQSQFREDLLLLPLLLGLALGRAGRFVEAGALDGLDISNTWMLERCFGWTGLLIEASPSNFAQLRRSGRSATMVHAALCADGTVVNVADGAARNGLRQRGAGGAEEGVANRGLLARSAYDEGHLRGLVPEAHLRPKVVFAQMKAMVAGEDDDGVIALSS